jgi:hypothetical protein
MYSIDSASAAIAARMRVGRDSAVRVLTITGLL